MCYPLLTDNLNAPAETTTEWLLGWIADRTSSAVTTGDETGDEDVSSGDTGASEGGGQWGGVGRRTQQVPEQVQPAAGQRWHQGRRLEETSKKEHDKGITFVDGPVFGKASAESYASPASRRVAPLGAVAGHHELLRLHRKA